MAQGEVLLEPSRSRLVQVDNRGKGIDDFDVFYPLFVDRRVRELRSVVPEKLDGELDVFGVELFAVRPFDAIPQVYRDRRKVVVVFERGGLPGMISPVFRFVYISAS